ncbi:MAG: transposase [Bacillota bacterium]|nr:transposase [Bacillota bacterium]
MSTFDLVLNEIYTLSHHEKEILYSTLEDLLTSDFDASEIKNEIKEHRFSKGRVSPHCGNHEVCRYGTSHGKQRYHCNSCNRTFTDFTGSPVSESKRPLEKWLQYAKRTSRKQVCYSCMQPI